MRTSTLVLCIALLALSAAVTRAQSLRTLSGVVVTPGFELVPDVDIDIDTAQGRVSGATDQAGRFSLTIPAGRFTVTISGKSIATSTRSFSASDNTVGVEITVSFLIPPLTESVTIHDDSLTPQIEFRNDSIYRNTLFTRDDQLVQSLNAGINAGQHEGGGKSLEVRRYGYNLDHGGVGGGLKILVDNIQQNQGTQGHGQGYLGTLKSLSPELVDDVSIINGPFSAAYGDFSGLGVVQIRQKESLPDVITARVQGGSFNTYRAFFAYSPDWKDLSTFISYEPSYTDGPFENPLRYRRDNVSANLTYKIRDREAVGFKLNFGRNNFTSSGQIPLDLVASGDLNRFGFLDPENGGRVVSGTAAIYYRKEFESGSTFKADTFVGRSLFDLYSNFTFFATDRIYGDEIQQHDSRLQEGFNIQYLRPYQLFGSAGVLTAGASFHANQINVGLFPSVARNPNRKFLLENLDNPNVLLTSARANVRNYAGYVQNELTFFDGRVRLETGLRLDTFTFEVDGFETSDSRREIVGKRSDAKLQPKVSLAWSPLKRMPLTFYGNYGRGISSQDARGVVRDPGSPKISTTDFYQVGASFNGKRFSAVLTSFLIDRSREQVYIPDDGSIELAGRSRSYGFEARTSARITRHLSFAGGLTRVLAAFYPGQFGGGERRIVDSAPHFVSNGGLVLSDVLGFNGSLTWRHISGYRLDPEDPSIRASGNDVVDLAISKRIRRSVDLNFAIDNVLNKKYYETQNYFESATCSTCDLASRIHATPGFPLTVSFGLTFRLGSKK